jgi:mycothiol synthase
MTPVNQEIRPFNLRSASPEEYASLNALKNVQLLEVWQDDPPHPCSEDVHRWQAMPEMIQDAAWAAWNDKTGQIVAFGEAYIYHTGDNPNLIEVKIDVLPKFRKQGLAREILHYIAAHARSQGRSLLMIECNDRVPAGAAFIERIGGRKGLDELTNQLRLSDLDQGLVQRWMEREATLSAEFALGLWDGPYPDERLEDMARLMQEVANDQPRDTLDLEDINFTPETVRQFDSQQRAGGDQRWSLYLTHRGDDSLIGITEVYWNPYRPGILWQGFTGVMPEHRNRGLGRWLKAAMLTRILHERPEVQVIRTGNADSNAPMLKINRALGFKPYIAWAVWQVDLDSVEKYLSVHPRDIP